ncbi:MAG: hypothetical protein WCP10_10915 [Desulfuromonadales bacterium]
MSVEYPIKFDIEPYLGNDAKRMRKFVRAVDIAHRIEEYVNSRMLGNESIMFDCIIVADALGVPTREVHDLIMTQYGLNNGITVVNPKLAK